MARFHIVSLLVPANQNLISGHNYYPSTSKVRPPVVANYGWHVRPPPRKRPLLPSSDTTTCSWFRVCKSVINWWFHPSHCCFAHPTTSTRLGLLIITPSSYTPLFAIPIYRYLTSFFHQSASQSIENRSPLSLPSRFFCFHKDTLRMTWYSHQRIITLRMAT